MEAMASRLLMVIVIVSRSALLVANGQETPFDVNVALGKPANQSSTYIGDKTWGDTDKFIYNASLAVDGKVETNFRKNSCSSTNGGQSSAWWEVDLENLYYITTIKIYQRSDVIRWIRGYLNDHDVFVINVDPSTLTLKLGTFSICIQSQYLTPKNCEKPNDIRHIKTLGAITVTLLPSVLRFIPDCYCLCSEL